MWRWPQRAGHLPTRPGTPIWLSTRGSDFRTAPVSRSSRPARSPGTRSGTTGRSPSGSGRTFPNIDSGPAAATSRSWCWSPSRRTRQSTRLSGTAAPRIHYQGGTVMTTADEERNKAFVLEAFDTLFNRRDSAAAQRFWSPDDIQHSAHIEPGRDGLFGLVKASPPNMRYENGLIVANGDYVMLHGRFTDIGQPANWIAADIVRLEDGLLAEHWDVLQDEATAGESVSGLPMFGETFPTRA